jgi:hypothetical protein
MASSAKDEAPPGAAARLGRDDRGSGVLEGRDRKLGAKPHPVDLHCHAGLVAPVWCLSA